MAFWDRWRRTQGTASRPYREGGFMVPRWSTPPERNTEEWVQAFKTNPRLAVVERIASDLSSAEGKLYRIGKDGEEQELDEHPFLEFWDNPNPLHEMSNAALWRLLEIYLALKGEGYFIIEKDMFGRPVELWPVPVHCVQMTPYLDPPYYTVRATSGTLMQVSVDDEIRNHRLGDISYDMISGGHEHEVRCKRLLFQHGHRLRGAAAPGWE